MCSKQGGYCCPLGGMAVTVSSLAFWGLLVGSSCQSLSKWHLHLLEAVLPSDKRDCPLCSRHWALCRCSTVKACQNARISADATAGHLLNLEASLAFLSLDTVTCTSPVMAGICSSAYHLPTLLRSSLLSVWLSFLCNVKTGTVIPQSFLFSSHFWEANSKNSLIYALWCYCRVVLQLLGWYSLTCERKTNPVKTSSLVTVIVAFHQGSLCFLLPGP